jgi:hypothetical protein
MSHTARLVLLFTIVIVGCSSSVALAAAHVRF